MSANPRTEADGRRLAQQMLVEIEDANERMLQLMDYDAYDDGRDGERMVYRRKPQCNLVAHYIARCGGNEAVLAGFGKVLTDYLASVAMGCQPILSKYSRSPLELPKAA